MNIPKFRAWHKKEKVMGKVSVLTDKGAFVIGVKPEDEDYYDSGKTITESPTDGRFCTFNEIELMQYSYIEGIYEGDIIAIMHNNQTIMTGYVKFDNGVFSAQLSDGFVVPLYELHKKYKLKVIGDVYRYPKLIK